MFDDECELTNEEILELMEKPNPHGLKPFGPDWEKEMDMHPLFMDDVPQEVIDGLQFVSYLFKIKFLTVFKLKVFNPQIKAFFTTN